MVAGWNFYDNNADTSDVFGHGTMVAGTAAATMANGAGVAGIAGRARIMPIRITDSAGSGYFSAAASGLTFAADNGARVANMSFSGMQRSSAVISAAQYFRSKGGVVTVSAGNTGTEVTDIAASDAMLAVSATDGADNKTSWSSWGTYVDVSAPGAGIYTTVRGGSYSAVNGTSFAAPLTAGVVALIMAAKPALTGAQVESLLLSTAVDLGATGKDTLFGTGRVDAHAAVLAAVNRVAPAPDTEPPAIAISRPLGSTTVAGQTAVDVTATDNVAVTQVELWVNGARVAVDTAAPFAFSWDTTRSANGMVSLVAVARDAAGNAASSSATSVNVANAAADTVAPTVAISNPVNGSRVSGNVSIQVEAADASGSAGLTQTLFINNKQVAKTTGATLHYSWNTRKVAPGSHVIEAVARDASGNQTSASVQVVR
jgi:subtilisin family serine protease